MFDGIGRIGKVGLISLVAISIATSCQAHDDIMDCGPLGFYKFEKGRLFNPAKLLWMSKGGTSFERSSECDEIIEESSSYIECEYSITVQYRRHEATRQVSPVTETEFDFSLQTHSEKTGWKTKDIYVFKDCEQELCFDGRYGDMTQFEVENPGTNNEKLYAFVANSGVEGEFELTSIYIKAYDFARHLIRFEPTIQEIVQRDEVISSRASSRYREVGCN